MLHPNIIRTYDGASIGPVVELDTLRGLDYMHTRSIQHRDLTNRNILVCHEPDRSPFPFSFKISDFGTACNYVTPDQPRGNRIHIAPEMLWCMISTAVGDVFSWYCVMWELYAKQPMIPFRDKVTPGYSRKTYAENLSKLIGVYKPENPSVTFETRYMRSIDAKTLCKKYRDRPTHAQVLAHLNVIRGSLNDDEFLEMSMLCITLFSQERCTTKELLSLNRYASLQADVMDATVRNCMVPSNLNMGEFSSTDVIVASDCVSDDLKSAAQKNPKVKVLEPSGKTFYGLDMFCLAPNYIQPYKWYETKRQELLHRYQTKSK